MLLSLSHGPWTCISHMPSLFSELIEGVDYIEFLEMRDSTDLSRALDGASSPIYIPPTVDLPFGRSIQKVAYVR